MGPTMARMVRKALDRAGNPVRVRAASRFSDSRARESLERHSIDTFVCDVLDREAVGLGTTVFIEISLNTQNEDLLDAFEDAVRQVPEVVSCYLMAGNSDYLVKVAVADVADYERIHRTHMARLPGVANLRSSFALRAVTEDAPIVVR